MRRSRPGPMSSPHEPVRSPHTGCIRCVDASPVAGSRRNRRTSGRAEGPSRPRVRIAEAGLMCLWQ
jgi:hypothetical protein